MKTTDTISLAPAVPSLFQIAAFFEDFFPSGSKCTAPVRHLPFAELMLDPRKLKRLLQTGRLENHAAAASSKEMAAPKQAPSSGAAARKSTGSGPNPGKPGGSSGLPRYPGPNPAVSDFRKVEFTLSSPAAGSVKLAGDFTEWEKSPVDMLHSETGVWSTTVPLAPGVYSYRFIVDGQWCDDPGCNRHSPNPYGGENAVIQVT
jgi:hypothetical protein